MSARVSMNTESPNANFLWRRDNSRASRADSSKTDDSEVEIGQTHYQRASDFDDDLSNYAGSPHNDDDNEFLAARLGEDKATPDR
jgi:hypothetical protein